MHSSMSEKLKLKIKILRLGKKNIIMSSRKKTFFTNRPLTPRGKISYSRWPSVGFRLTKKRQSILSKVQKKKKKTRTPSLQELTSMKTPTSTPSRTARPLWNKT